MYNEIAELTFSVAEHRSLIINMIRKFINYYKYSHIKIGVVGPGGVGKTTVGHFLAGDTKSVQDSSAYRESRGTEKFNLEGEYISTITVVPGQEHRRDDHWNKLTRNLQQGKSRGIINLVSYGYHSFGQMSYKQHPSYEESMSKDDFLLKYFSEKRAEEISVMEERIVPAIKLIDGPIWMITLVTKQDLWWTERNQVEAHYRKGEYNRHIENLEKSLGVQNFKHEYLSVCLTANNFRSGTGEDLALVTAGYDDPLRLTNLSDFTRTINNFVTMGD